MKKVLTGLLLCSVAAGLAVPTFAQAPANPPAAPPPAPPLTSGAPATFMPRELYPAPCILGAVRIVSPRMMPLLNERLTLTADQQTKANALLTKADDELKPLIEAQRKAAENFATVASKPNATVTEITTAADNAMKAETNIVDQKIKTLVAFENILTDAQKKTFATMLDQQTSMWKQRPVPVAPRIVATPAPPPPAPKK